MKNLQSKHSVKFQIIWKNHLTDIWKKNCFGKIWRSFDVPFPKISFVKTVSFNARNLLSTICKSQILTLYEGLVHNILIFCIFFLYTFIFISLYRSVGSTQIFCRWNLPSIDVSTRTGYIGTKSTNIGRNSHIRFWRSIFTTSLVYDTINCPQNCTTLCGKLSISWKLFLRLFTVFLMNRNKLAHFR